ncbi:MULTISPECIES: LysR family transcriptional regulator [Streptomyces]|uniref:LysR family transcriptional regulator n=1 Tax=Streptomyces cavourensis TaxID=67258 RepID=A0AAD0Q7R8_9ACTN|nr:MULTISPECIES: LysR family transcriptional regulator [Streptomyces]NUW20942.1 LysR family transcriptional regulator [Streptomyces roseoviolaceus]ALC27587.1 peptidase [Streptomyces sp. CFMR 7]ATY98090.1 LysR family transcriptional regulator [Streptomyces cavourensis]AXI73916.1 LysR family transcriptional regulator [Streptomyces cavourensis]MBT3075672.1 LysR family transcriptional regulator [Streptomyces sp. COG21]
MELEVRHLRALCAIADAGSLHQAARRLGVSQPSLTTQLRRIENSLGAELFRRERTGCRPTLLGRAVLSRARPLVDGMSALVSDALAEADAARARGPRLRIGSTASRVIGGWLSRLRVALPGTDISLRVDVSAHALLRSVEAGLLDVAFVHEVEGSPLAVPDGLEQRVLLDREPQFISLSRDHPAARSRVVELADLAGDRWMVDPTVDGEWDGVRRVLGAAGLNPPVLHGDYLTAASLVVLGEAVAPCQPTSGPRDDMAIRPLRGDPLAVRLLLVSRPGADISVVYGELEAAYVEAARRSSGYYAWLLRHRSPLARTP